MHQNNRTRFISVGLTILACAGAFAAVIYLSTPSRPKVLLIGDSISMGYAPRVANLLSDIADVRRIPENGGPSRYGRTRIKEWLKGGPWRVIYFNFGLHDQFFLADPIDYSDNLKSIVRKLKSTGAHLIFATTTSVPNEATLYHPEMQYTYRDAAITAMKHEGIQINDLLLIQAEHKPGDVHFTTAGSALLAEEVSRAIREVIKRVTP